MIKKILFVFFVLFLSFAILNPNPFGNNPDAIADESYFLTSSLSAIEKYTLPGWEFSASGNYYGGPQTYLDTIILIPVLGIIAANQGFSVLSTKIWVALNTGELLHILRLANGVFALGVLAFCFVLFKKKIPRELSEILTLFLFLLLSNALLIQILHSAKMWAFYAIVVSAMNAFFIANEYFISRFHKPFFPKEKYIALLIWSTAVVFFQSIVGAFSILLLILYSILLRHVTFREVWKYTISRWYWFLLFALTQISFIYRAVFINLLSGSSAGISLHTAKGEIDWPARLSNAIVWTWESQPWVVVLYIAGILALVYIFVRQRSFFESSRKRIYLSIATLHPILTYIIFHIIIGFSLAPRYAIMLTLALAFSLTILLSEINKKLVNPVTMLCAILFLVIGMKSIYLSWQPSSEKIVERTIMEKYNSPDMVFLIEPSALRLTLPINDRSISLLNEKRKTMGRFAFLSQYPDRVREAVAFKPRTLTVYDQREKAAALMKLRTSTSTVWTITNECTALCTSKETQAGTCFAVNIEACGEMPSEPNILKRFLSFKQLGLSFIARKI